MNTHLEDYIKKLLLSLEITKASQLNEDISIKLGIPVYTWDEPSRCSFHKGKYSIFLNNRLSKVDRWKQFCHELGHALWHYGDKNVMPFPYIQMQEWQANNFMLHLAIPSFMLEKLKLPTTRSQSILMISEVFNVDFALAEKRLDMYFRKKHESLYFQKIKMR
ncbi:ImmA/IrrE family metallo-endopeptidase [Sediminibacillus terrae]|uniref:ImmA/IrrE family metallo-endopeptidase n=1 Tax=Sediminibacillus terrae TaxID=1562106 RepID=UPI001387218D|nr:ImmA/IrrE family metallo-endopeptidase [Sediminibacillus terrae]